MQIYGFREIPGMQQCVQPRVPNTHCAVSTQRAVDRDSGMSGDFPACMQRKAFPAGVTWQKSSLPCT